MGRERAVESITHVLSVPPSDDPHSKDAKDSAVIMHVADATSEYLQDSRKTYLF